MANYNSGYNYNSGFLYNARIQYLTVGGTVNSSSSITRAASFLRQLVSSLSSSSAISRRKSGIMGNAHIAVSSSINKRSAISVSIGAIGIAGSISRQIFKQISAVIGISSVVDRVSQFYRNISGSLATSKLLLKTTEKSFTATIGIQSAIEKVSMFYRSITPSILISGNISKIASFFRAFIGSSSISSLIATAATFRRVLGIGIVAPAGNIVKTICKSIFDEVIISKDIMEFVGNGTVAIKSHLRRLKYHFFVTLDGILMPLGVKILRDSRVEIIPSVRDNSEEIPGRHGEIDFGSELGSRLIEFHVATDEMTPEEKESIKREFTKHIGGNAPKSLVFEADMSKTYDVKYAGKIDPTQYPNWMDFVVPFKMSEPFIEDSEDKELVGTGTLSNEGNIETGLIIEIAGAAANPSVVIGDVALTYTGNIAAGQTLVIDTEAQTVMIGSNNAMAGYNGEFPLLQSGSVNVETDNKVTIHWKDKYL